MGDVSVFVGIKRSDSCEGLSVANSAVNMRSLMVIYLLFCYASVTSGTGNVFFTSKDFTNILKWDPAAPRVPGQEVRYDVAYETDTDQNNFVKKAECQNITERFCDLTSETPAVFDVRYRARVWADGLFHGQTKTFKPIAETVLSAPILSLDATTTSLHVNVTLPLGPKEESIKDILTRIKKGPSKPTVVYSLHITQPLWAAQEIENTTGDFMVSLKNDQTEYCGYVLYKPAFEWGRPPSENTNFCVTLPDNVWTVMPWSIMTGAVVMVVVAVAVFCLWRYVKDVKEPTPQSMDIPNNIQVFHLPDVDGCISKVVISPTVTGAETVYAKIRMTPSATSPVDGYGHRNTILNPWLEEGCSAGLRYREDSSQSSEIYGAVAIHKEGEEDLHLLQTHGLDQSGPVLTSVKTLPLLENVDIYENSEAKPLLLETQRDSDGQLILPMLSFEVQKTFSGTTEALSAAERKPLLPYLIVSDKRPSFVSLNSLDSSECSDSGCDENSNLTPTHDYCNSQYLPTQQVQLRPGSHRSLSYDSGTDDSAYKQNWMPPIHVDTNNCGNSPYSWSWSGLKEEGETEDEKTVQE